ncbi:transcriptional regulator [Limnoraphis robusta]|uniref:transcriptional regulator n=1 Tax=Limnoraphis robusta TaxID=1118279 RepID=UPI002B1F6017|nr:transcriptional regulator [Limnoraphis robusta]MEA5500033.1 transcriptional regulator [Limnoraphis robusta BA-68 BA1]
MSSSKLSDAEKQEIVKLYQQMPEETTITLADRYGVSSSTVRRVLQSAIPKDTYETLTQQKQRLHRTGKRSTRNAEELEESIFTPMLELEYPEPEYSEPEYSEPEYSEPEYSEPEYSEPEYSEPEYSEPEYSESEYSESEYSESEYSEPEYREVSSLLDSFPVTKRRRKRSSASENVELSESSEVDLEVDTVTTPKPILKSGDEQSNYSSDSTSANIKLIAEDFLREEYSEFDPDEDEDEDDLEDYSDDEEREKFFTSPLSMAGLVKILPLAEAELPKICYLVIDRAAELVAKPLKAFSELGQIPADEIHEKTLPVFDNHRVASRFSARNQRVFKVPDSRLLQKAAPCLQAKGITRLLIDGQVYRF